MSEHKATITWNREGRAFTYETYSRDHEWTFAGGAAARASAAPAFRGNPDLVDPEAALVAALSSCHMLTFLALAARRGLVIDAYSDDAVGFLEKNAEGKLAVTRVVLRPRIDFGGAQTPAPEVVAELHEKAHDQCFIANSVRTAVTIEPAKSPPAPRGARATKGAS
jgi:organic hydroperoxide reductase OsmC/OhrA